MSDNRTRPSIARLLALALGAFLLGAGPVYLFAFLTGFTWVM